MYIGLIVKLLIGDHIEFNVSNLYTYTKYKNGICVCVYVFVYLSVLRKYYYNKLE